MLAERVFAARHLGSSKALLRLRAPIEQRLGSLEALGVREGAAVTLVGGEGRLVLGNGAELELVAAPPLVSPVRPRSRCNGSSCRALVSSRLRIWRFDACCRGEVVDLRGAMFVLTAGYPGRGVGGVVEAASRGGAAGTAWCDLDLDGIRIARIIAGWTGDARYHRMGPDDLRSAPATIPLDSRSLRSIERELRNGRGHTLTPTLQVLRQGGVWAEQEVFLARPPH